MNSEASRVSMENQSSVLKIVMLPNRDEAIAKIRVDDKG
jgi:hypothetical protein